MSFKKNLNEVITKIEKARIAYSRHHIVQLIAVSKYVSEQDIQNLYDCGQRAFGENKVQDLKHKIQALNELPLQWHMIGKLQENKINTLLALKPALLHSLDSFELALSIEKRCIKDNITLKALLQVNSSNELTKSGVKPQEAFQIYLDILKHCPHINLEGLMSIGANTEDMRKIEDSFSITKDIFDKLAPYGAKTLSMGMSNDFEIAISYGANMVRIGSALFAK